MLVLSRRPGEKIVIGDDIIVTVTEISGNRVRLAVDAPCKVPILRGELTLWQDEPAADDSADLVAGDETLGGCWRLRRG
jgi:carbon storage regulator